MEKESPDKMQKESPDKSPDKDKMQMESPDKSTDRDKIQMESPDETTTVTIATFNCENLFARYRYEDFHHSEKVKLMKKNRKPVKYFNLCSKRFYFFREKKFTAMAIAEADADIIFLQEIESLRVLERFRNEYLKKLGYRYAMMIESKDSRLIGNACLSRYKVETIRPHREVENSIGMDLFSRGIQDVEFDIEGHPLRVINCHFTSMSRGRRETSGRRHEQAEFVRSIIKTISHKNFIVLGDLNTYNDKLSRVSGLVHDERLCNVIERMGKTNQWTHYSNKHNRYSQLDYILLSKELAEENKYEKPRIVRNGLPHRAVRYKGKRFKGIGKNRPKASDHCPVSMKITLL